MLLLFNIKKRVFFAAPELKPSIGPVSELFCKYTAGRIAIWWGIGPVNSLWDRSNISLLDKYPTVAGIVPVNEFESNLMVRNNVNLLNQCEGMDPFRFKLDKFKTSAETQNANIIFETKHQFV